MFGLSFVDNLYFDLFVDVTLVQFYIEKSLKILVMLVFLLLD